MSGTRRYRLGVDVGGTHTDLVLLDVVSGALEVEKVSSTPSNPALGVLKGISRFVNQGVNPGDIEFFSHGTTITTNAILEMRGAKTGLLITAGFRAVQETQKQARDGNPFDYFYQKPIPVAPQSLTHDIPGRIDYEGRELTPLGRDRVQQAARALRAAGVTSIAVCYLFSFMNPAHEQETRRIILEEFPEAHVSLSSEVLPRIREWPRLSTTLLNAYLEPVLMDYIRYLAKGLDKEGIGTQQRFLMQSNGGVMPFTAAVSGGRCVYTLLSGPAAGVRASAYLGGEAAQRGLVTLDMGGTSCDIAFIEGGIPLEVTEGEIARRQLDVPALDLTTISAGGGSIAWIDSGGFLCVGPKSAGAYPGPACYGQGGRMPAVTDADLACGYLNPQYFLGGTQVLDFEASIAALKRHVADPLGLNPLEAAVGIIRIVDMRMADEVRVHAAKRGVDAHDFTLLPFGGAGAVHGAAVAAELGVNRILIPPRPGAFSALGLLCTDVVHDYIRSELRPLNRMDPQHGEKIFAELEERAKRELRGEGLNPADAAMERELDLRYTGQGYELRVSLEGICEGPLDESVLARTRNRFDERHALIHGHAAMEKTVEVVSYRLRVRVAVPKFDPVPEIVVTAAPVPAEAEKGTRTVYFDGRSAVDTKIYERDRLFPGVCFTGPAIVEQFDATTVVPEGWSASVDSCRYLNLQRKVP